MDRATRPDDDAFASSSPSSSSLARNASSVATESSPLLIMSSESSQTSQVASRPKATTIWEDIKAHRRAYVLTAIASFGGMLFGSV